MYTLLTRLAHAGFGELGLHQLHVRCGFRAGAGDCDTEDSETGMNLHDMHVIKSRTGMSGLLNYEIAMLSALHALELASSTLRFVRHFVTSSQ